MFGVYWSAPTTLWLNLANLVLSLVVLSPHFSRELM